MAPVVNVDEAFHKRVLQVAYLFFGLLLTPVHWMRLATFDRGGQVDTYHLWKKTTLSANGVQPTYYVPLLWERNVLRWEALAVYGPIIIGATATLMVVAFGMRLVLRQDPSPKAAGLVWLSVIMVAVAYLSLIVLSGARDWSMLHVQEGFVVPALAASSLTLIWCFLVLRDLVRRRRVDINTS